MIKKFVQFVAVIAFFGKPALAMEYAFERDLVVQKFVGELMGDLEGLFDEVAEKFAKGALRGLESLALSYSYTGILTFVPEEDKKPPLQLVNGVRLRRDDDGLF
jgi:hypothetical protein